MSGVQAGPPVDAGQPAQRRPDDQEHGGRVREGEQHPPLRAGPGQRDYHRQERPGQHVRRRGAGQRDPADAGPVQTAVAEDAGQDREGGSRHGGADEQREGGDVGQVVTMGQPHPQRRPEDQRQGHRSGRHAEGDPLAAPDKTQVELVADDEHEQDETEISQRCQRGDLGGREQRRGDLAVKERRPEQDPGEDLAQHRRLTEPPGGRTEQPGQDDDDRHVRQEQLEIIEAHGAPAPSAGYVIGAGESRSGSRTRRLGGSRRRPPGRPGPPGSGWCRRPFPAAGSGCRSRSSGRR